MKRTLLWSSIIIAVSIIVTSSIIVYANTGDREITTEPNLWKTLEREVSINGLTSNQKVTWNLTAEGIMGNDIYRYVQIDVPDTATGDAITMNKVYLDESTSQLVAVFTNSDATRHSFNVTIMVGKMS